MFVYLTICLANGKSYIGKYEGKESDKYLGSGKLLLRAIKKFGREKFERHTLERFNDSESCRLGEKAWIVRLNAVKSKDFYNIADGGEGGNTFKNMNPAVVSRFLKKRKNIGTHLIGRTSTSGRNLVTGKCCVIEPHEIKSLPFMVGVSCKGVYVTPFGNFTNLAVSTSYTGLDFTSLSSKCRRNETKIFRGHLQSVEPSSVYYQHILANLGRTFKEAGYDFIPVAQLLGKPLSFYESLKLIK